MDSSRRAVESYWRSRMIDAATSDEDKVTPVYKLEEICELLRSSPAGIVKEVSEFVLKRLDHKSPIVKQKALRLIKYSVGKSGPEFRREMQRHSVAVKQLLHYKGQPDPLKGDALNKAVRETAQDALSAIFSTDDNKPAVSEVNHRRMEGFGNPNFVPPPEEKKSLISEIVDLGSASLKQGLSNLAQGHSFVKNDTGSYRGPNLQRSLTATTKVDYATIEHYNRSVQGIPEAFRHLTSGPRGQDSRTGHVEATNGDSSSGHTGSKTREERLLETIVTSGGVRLQPTRDALQAFLVEASKMDALALCNALDSKLQAPLWQVRIKAVCVLEAILRKKDDEHFAIIASYFSENIDIVIKCSESPQASLREKANRVLSLLGGGQPGNASERSAKVEKTVVEMPDLIDTGDNDLLVSDGPEEGKNDQHVVAAKSSSASPLIDDLFGGDMSCGLSTSEHRTDDDPFADVSFHAGDDGGQGTDLFAGMTVGENSNASISAPSGGSDPFDIFGSSEPVQKQEVHACDVNNLMAGLSINENGSMVNQKAASPAVFSESLFSDSSSKPDAEALNQPLSNVLDPQNTSNNANAMFPMGAMPFNIPSGMLLNQFYPPQTLNYAAMGGLLAQQQQQLMTAMANFQSLGTFNSQNIGAGNVAGTLGGDSSSAFPDIFNANLPAQTATVTMNASKKEDTKAFDFISDHLAAARDPKRVI